MIQWSKYQLDFFQDVAKGKGNTVVEACAGSGKSTSLMQGIRHIPSSVDTLITSFSNACVDDLKAKATNLDNSNWAGGPDVRTLNSHGYRACRDEFGKLEVDKNRVYTVLEQLFGDPPQDGGKRQALNALSFRVKSVVDLAKNFLADKPAEIIKLADDFEIGQEIPDWAVKPLDDQFGGYKEGELFARIALKTMEMCKKPTGGKIDFNDQIWLPAVLKLDLEKFDRIFVDEAQDLCPAQLDMVFRSISKNGRITAIGDNFQSIYEWRGAGIGMKPFIERGKAKTLPLSISYRCPKAVVREAQKIVKHIETSPTAIEGLVDTIPLETLPGRVKAGDVILSRKNSPLVRIFFEYLQRGVPVAIQGRDLGGALLSLLSKSGAKSVQELRDFVGDWAKKEIEVRRERFPNCSIDSIEDRQISMNIICDLSTDVAAVKRNIERLMPPEERRWGSGNTNTVRRGFHGGGGSGSGAEVILSSVHRAKGREWDRVFLVESSFSTSEHFWRTKSKGDPDSPSTIKWARQRAKEIIETEREESNIRYVAITRAKQELYFAT